MPLAPLKDPWQQVPIVDDEVGLTYQFLAHFTAQSFEFQVEEQ